MYVYQKDLIEALLTFNYCSLGRTDATTLNLFDRFEMCDIIY